MLATRLAMTVRNSAGAVNRGRIASPYRSIINSHIPPPSASIIASNFSTSSTRLSEKKSNKDPSKSPDEIPPMEFSLRGLGMSRNIRILVIMIISIFGTIETVFWIKTIWSWISDPKDDESANKA